MRRHRSRLTVSLTVAAAALLWVGPAPAQKAGPVLVVGDSLEVGTGPQLKRELSGEDVVVDARTGRPSSEGVDVLRGLLRPAHRVVVFDLGTNDDPSQPGKLRSSLAAARQLAGKRCLVVSTLVRPPLSGVSVTAMNEVVQRFEASTPTVRLADWRATASRSPALLSRDGVHATPNGYTARARLVAEAVRSCSAVGDDRGLPAARAPKEDRPEPEPRSRHASPGGLWSELFGGLPVDLPITVLRSALDLVTGAAEQAQGAIVPPVPDPALGRPGDPLGKRSH